MKDVGRHDDEWEPGNPRTRSHPAVSFLLICNDETQSGEAGVNVVVNGPRFDIMDAVCGAKENRTTTVTRRQGQLMYLLRSPAGSHVEKNQQPSYRSFRGENSYNGSGEEEQGCNRE